MKDQYFGDINDYRKYGLLRALQTGSCLRLLVGWMLTPDDESGHGRGIGYLHRVDRYRHCDPELFDALYRWVVVRQTRRTELLHSSGLLADTEWFADIVPDRDPDRQAWTRSILQAAPGRDLVFLDPDVGLEVHSVPAGRRGSSRYVYWTVIERLWQTGVSLLVYQHYPRRPHGPYQRDRLQALRSGCGADLTVGLSTPAVLFLLAGQRHHRHALEHGLAEVRRRWADQITEVRWP